MTLFFHWGYCPFTQNYLLSYLIPLIVPIVLRGVYSSFISSVGICSSTYLCFGSVFIVKNAPLGATRQKTVLPLLANFSTLYYWKICWKTTLWHSSKLNLSKAANFFLERLYCFTFAIEGLQKVFNCSKSELHTKTTFIRLPARSYYSVSLQLLRFCINELLPSVIFYVPRYPYIQERAWKYNVFSLVHRSQFT